MAYVFKDPIDRPSVQLANLLSGKTAWDDAAPSIRSWAAFQIHKAAKAVVRMKKLEDRRAALAKIPDSIRPHVQAEIVRLWK